MMGEWDEFGGFPEDKQKPFRWLLITAVVSGGIGCVLAAVGWWLLK
jgi:hypothetical protein